MPSYAHRMAFRWAGRVQSAIENISNGIHICPRQKTEPMIPVWRGLLRLNLLVSSSLLSLLAFYFLVESAEQHNEELSATTNKMHTIRSLRGKKKLSRYKILISYLLCILSHSSFEKLQFTSGQIVWDTKCKINK